MATRFGGAHSNQQQARRLRLVVGFLLVSILLLIVILVVTSGGGNAPQNAAAVSQPQNPVQNAPVSPTVEVLVSTQRIEQGTQLQAFMFEAKPWDVETLPPGAVLAKDLNTVVGKFANTIVNANLPLLEEHVIAQQPINSFTIPPGHRAVTINVDSRTAVEGFAKPNTRVDVLLAYTGNDKEKRVTTIVPFAKVLSVSGATAAEGNKAQISGQTTVTLLVTIKQAKKIELARSLGELSLNLVGDQETATVSPEESEEVTSRDIFPVPNVRNEEIPADGVMYTTDQLTGKKVRYLLRSGKWVRDTSSGN